jgi:Carotenoid biosynthesis protein
MMIYPSWMVARALLRGVDTHSVCGLTVLAAIAALVMTAWDVVMDPGMAADGNWVWEHGGAYFGVPRHNYLAWLLTTFLVYWITGLLWRSGSQSTAATRTFAALPVIVYAFFAARYVATNPIAALQLIPRSSRWAFRPLWRWYRSTSTTREPSKRKAQTDGNFGETKSSTPLRQLCGLLALSSARLRVSQYTIPVSSAVAIATAN